MRGHGGMRDSGFLPLSSAEFSCSLPSPGSTRQSGGTSPAAAARCKWRPSLVSTICSVGWPRAASMRWPRRSTDGKARVVTFECRGGRGRLVSVARPRTHQAVDRCIVRANQSLTYRRHCLLFWVFGRSVPGSGGGSASRLIHPSGVALIIVPPRHLHTFAGSVHDAPAIAKPIERGLRVVVIVATCLCIHIHRAEEGARSKSIISSRPHVSAPTAAAAALSGRSKMPFSTFFTSCSAHVLLGSVLLSAALSWVSISERSGSLLVTMRPVAGGGVGYRSTRSAIRRLNSPRRVVANIARERSAVQSLISPSDQEEVDTKAEADHIEKCLI